MWLGKARVAYVAAAIATTVWCSWAGASDTRYVEDFTTRHYCDELNTTAWWDTVSGELKLPPLALSLAESYSTAGKATGVAVSGDQAHMADGNDLVVREVFESAFDLNSNTGQSLVLNRLNEEIHVVRMTSTQTDSVYWYVSADSGSVWDEITPDNTWHQLTSCGSDLVWRSRHICVQQEVNPTCTSLEIEWLYNSAVIDSVVDEPADEGGWARVYFTRSGFDIVEEFTYPIARYDVLRRIDDVAMAAMVLEEARPLLADMGSVEGQNCKEMKVPKSIGASPVLSLDGRYFVKLEQTQVSGRPPGVWEIVLGMSATQEDQYTCIVPTVADSASSLRYSVYCVVAHTTTPSVYYFSPPDSGYSVDNLPPQMPIGLAGQYMGDMDLRVQWNPNVECDLSYYAVYRGTTAEFTADEGSRIGTTTGTFVVDDDFGYDGPHYYKVSAYDLSGNESDHALLAPEELTDVPGRGVGLVNALYQNAPNPFGTGTQIVFSLDKASRVCLKIFDVKGRLVRELLDEERPPSRYVEEWDGTDSGGRFVAAGTYFYRLELPGWSASRKMMFAR